MEEEAAADFLGSNLIPGRTGFEKDGIVIGI
jgi:hypothetical protein